MWNYTLQNQTRCSMYEGSACKRSCVISEKCVCKSHALFPSTASSPLTRKHATFMRSAYVLIWFFSMFALLSQQLQQHNSQSLTAELSHCCHGNGLSIIGLPPERHRKRGLELVCCVSELNSLLHLMCCLCLLHLNNCFCWNWNCELCGCFYWGYWR